MSSLREHRVKKKKKWIPVAAPIPSHTACVLLMKGYTYSGQLSTLQCQQRRRTVLEKQWLLALKCLNQSSEDYISTHFTHQELANLHLGKLLPWSWCLCIWLHASRTYFYYQQELISASVFQRKTKQILQSSQRSMPHQSSPSVA